MQKYSSVKTQRCILQVEPPEREDDAAVPARASGRVARFVHTLPDAGAPPHGNGAVT